MAYAGNLNRGRAAEENSYAEEKEGEAGLKHDILKNAEGMSMVGLEDLIKKLIVLKESRG